MCWRESATIRFTGSANSCLITGSHFLRITPEILWQQSSRVNRKAVHKTLTDNVELNPKDWRIAEAPRKKEGSEPLSLSSLGCSVTALRRGAD
jgi:hypothetical protein